LKLQQKDTVSQKTILKTVAGKVQLRSTSKTWQQQQKFLFAHSVAQ